MFDVINYLNEIINGFTYRVDANIINYLGVEPFIFPQLIIEGGVNKATKINLIQQNKLEVRWSVTHQVRRNIEPYKSVIVPYISTLVFDKSIAIGIIRNTGNREDKYSQFLPINYREHNQAARYLFDFIKADCGPDLEIYNNIGSFSGDIQSEYRSIDLKYYELDKPLEVEYLNKVLEYTQKYVI